MPIRTPAILFIVLYAGFLLYVGQTVPLLPERVATHFGMNGEPNGWMGRPGYSHFIRIFGLTLPAFTVAVGFLIRFLPAWTVNIPNRDYWLAPAHRPETYSALLGFCFWLACLEVGLVGGMHYLTLVANRSAPVHLPSSGLVAVLGLFIVGLLLCVIALVRCFRMPN